MPDRTFRPAWWLPGPHAQTIGARLLRRRTGVEFRRERVPTHDGDFLDLDWVARVDGRPVLDTGPLAIVLHGLEGSARSDYALQLYRTLAQGGIAAVGLNFRGCSGEINRVARMYHSGETGDVAAMVERIVRQFPGRPLGAVGFSLGGNVLLKFLGERGAERGADGGPIAAAVSISVPFNLAAGAERLSQGFARVYQWFLMRKLQDKLRAKVSLVRDHVDVDRALAARTFWDFDDAATAPLHGFEGADDYYRRSSCNQYLASVRVPTLLIHALDDPFLPQDAVPVDAPRENPVLESAFTPGGGHVGFVSGPPWSPAFWAEQTAAQYLVQKLTRSAT